MSLSKMSDSDESDIGKNYKRKKTRTGFTSSSESEDEKLVVAELSTPTKTQKAMEFNALSSEGSTSTPSAGKSYDCF